MLLSDNLKVVSARIFLTSVFVSCGPGTSSNEGPGRAVFLLNSNSGSRLETDTVLRIQSTVKLSKSRHTLFYGKWPNSSCN
jgi:hypothetical protein